MSFFQLGYVLLVFSLKNPFNNLSSKFEVDFMSITCLIKTYVIVLSGCLNDLLIKLHKFNKKKWESSFYKLGREIGKGNFGRVHKAVVLVNERIPPELRRCEVSREYILKS